MHEDGEYLEHNPSWHTENSAWKAQQVAKILVKNGLSPATIHEVGDLLQTNTRSELLLFIDVIEHARTTSAFRES